MEPRTCRGRRLVRTHVRCRNRHPSANGKDAHVLVPVRFERFEHIVARRRQMPRERRHRFGTQEIDRAVWLKDFVVCQVDRRWRFGANGQSGESAAHTVKRENNALAVVQRITPVRRRRDLLTRDGLSPLHLEIRIVLKLRKAEADEIVSSALQKARDPEFRRGVSLRPLPRNRFRLDDAERRIVPFARQEFPRVLNS